MRVGTKSFHPQGLADCRVSPFVCSFLAFSFAFLLLVVWSTARGEESASEGVSQVSENDDASELDPEDSEDFEDDWETDPDELNRNESSFSTLEDILAYEASEYDYKTTRRCVESRRVRDYDVLSDRFILVQMRDLDTKYLIQLDRKCAGMTKGATLRFDSRRGSSLRVCTNDSVRANMATDWGPPCRLPGFEPINEVQLEQLTRGLVSERVE